MFCIECGEGLQYIRWLGDVGIFRYEHFFAPVNGNTKGMRFETGEILDMTQKICETLKDEIHIWVILKEEMDGLKLEMMKNSMEVPKVFSLENENFMKNTASNDFRIRPQSSMPRLRKK